MTPVIIDLNADLGEGCSYDAELVPLVSSVNISCGAHAGSDGDIRAALEYAAQWQVAAGAHPSYPDRDNLGRRSMTLPAAALRDSLLRQFDTLAALAAQSHTQLRHVKPHGALYNDAAVNVALAEQLCAVIADFDRELTVVGLAGSKLQDAARKAGLDWRAEAFVDRRYQADGTLVGRHHQRALLDNPADAVAQALAIIQHRQVTALDGEATPVDAQTLCIHGDTPGALQFARQLRAALEATGIRVMSPVNNPPLRHRPGHQNANND